MKVNKIKNRGRNRRKSAFIFNFSGNAWPFKSVAGVVATTIA